MIRHKSHPEQCNLLVVGQETGAETVHVVISINGATQRLLLTPTEARALAACLINTADEIEI
jgi:hypothetical protein